MREESETIFYASPHFRSTPGRHVDIIISHSITRIGAGLYLWYAVLFFLCHTCADARLYPLAAYPTLSIYLLLRGSTVFLASSVPARVLQTQSRLQTWFFLPGDRVNLLVLQTPSCKVKKTAGGLLARLRGVLSRPSCIIKNRPSFLKFTVQGYASLSVLRAVVRGNVSMI